MPGGWDVVERLKELEGKPQRTREENEEDPEVLLLAALGKKERQGNDGQLQTGENIDPMGRRCPRLPSASCAPTARARIQYVVSNGMPIPCAGAAGRFRR